MLRLNFITVKLDRTVVAQWNPEITRCISVLLSPTLSNTHARTPPHAHEVTLLPRAEKKLYFRLSCEHRKYRFFSILTVGHNKQLHISEVLVCFWSIQSKKEREKKSITSPKTVKLLVSLFCCPWCNRPCPNLMTTDHVFRLNGPQHRCLQQK